MKKLLISLILLSNLQMAHAFEDCLIVSDAKLSDISIEHNDIIDVCPIFTIMNEKNTLLVHPLKQGETRFCVLKNNKDKIMFNVQVSEGETKIDEKEGFEIITIDEPPEGWDLDIPPQKLGEIE